MAKLVRDENENLYGFISGPSFLSGADLLGINFGELVFSIRWTK